MGKRVLRSFLYLDENIVGDYLSQLEGGLIEGPYTTKDVSSGSKEGGLGFKFPIVDGSGKAASTSSLEIQQTIRETPMAKFTRLYELLQKDEMIQPLNGFDLEVYNQIEPGEIVEVRGFARLPQWEHLTKVVSDIYGLIEIMKALGQDPLADQDTNQAYQGFSTLITKKAQEDVELIIEPIGSPNFKFVAKLDTARILRRREELEAEVTILGKVRHKLAERETIDIFRIAPRLDKLENLNRAQRRSVGKGKAKLPSTDSPLDEVIKYPAMQLQAIAVYQ